jgi:hypothetical protein
MQVIDFIRHFEKCGVGRNISGQSLSIDLLAARGYAYGLFAPGF